LSKLGILSGKNLLWLWVVRQGRSKKLDRGQLRQSLMNRLPNMYWKWVEEEEDDLCMDAVTKGGLTRVVLEFDDYTQVHNHR
jgi:hypothetical protein